MPENIASIQTALANFLGPIPTPNPNSYGVTGMVTGYSDEPAKAPENADCPFVVVRFRDPDLDVLPVAMSLTQYNWHFEIVFGLCPAGVGTKNQKFTNIKPFPARFVAKMNSNNSLGGTVKSVRFTSAFNIGFFELQGISFYGFRWELDAFENVQETYAA